MPELLFDSTILIDLLRDYLPAYTYIEGLSTGTVPLTHAMVHGEIVVGSRDARDLARFKRLFRQFELIHANEQDSELALNYLARFHLSHDLGFPDCLIATTALRRRFPVVTINDRHFRLFKGLTVIRPY